MTRRRPATPTLGRRIQFAVAALLAPVAVGACQGGLTDSPTPSTTTTTPEVVVIEGRPLRRRNGRIHRARSRRGHSHITDRHALWLSPTVRDALAEAWREQAELEHASIVAFHDLAARLTRVGAPAELVAGANRAAEQEADHAGRCFDLAARYLGESLRPGRLRPLHRRHRSREQELAALAVEALRDGVVNEGYAAWLAGERRARATDQLVRAALDVITLDEADHARLSADVLQWCIAEGGATTRAAVDEAAAALPERMVACVIPHGVERTALAAHGVSDPDLDGHGYRAVRDAALEMVGALASAPG